MSLSHKMTFLENVCKTYPWCPQKASNLYTFSLVGSDINALILETQTQECLLTFLFKISLEFANVFMISLCKPSVATIKSQAFSPKSLVPSLQFRILPLQLFSCNPSDTSFQWQPFRSRSLVPTFRLQSQAFSYNPSVAKFQFEPVCPFICNPQSFSCNQFVATLKFTTLW